MAMVDYAPFNEARDRQSEPEALRDFAERIGPPPGTPVAVTKTAVGSFAQEPDGSWRWVAI